VRFSRVRSTRSELLGDCREFPERLLMEDEPKREPRAFVLAMSKTMGRKGGRKERSLVAETRKQVTDFYRDLVQGLVPPRTKAPKIREDEKKKSEMDTSLPPEPKVESEAKRQQEAQLRRPAEVMPFAPR
jgi:hypothetical protein